MVPPSPPPNASRRRRATARQYWVRRVGALAVVGLVGYSLVRVAGSIIGDGESTVEADPPASLEICDTVTDADADAGTGTDVASSTDVACVETGDGSAAGTDPTADTAADPTNEPAATDATTSTSTSTTEPEPENTGPPAADNKAKVYIVGDSDAGTFGPYLEQLLDGTLIVDTELNYKVSSGLARPDFFNWPAELATTLPEVDPDIVVVTFGGNDSQGLSLPQEELEFIIGDPVENEAEWSEEYQRRAGEVMDLLLEDDRRVIWVGIPNDDNADVTARLAIQDQAAKAAAAERPEVVFIDTWTRFSGRDGNWAEFVVDPRDGSGKDVRADDGFHLNTNGAEILALDIAVAVRDQLRDMGAAI